MKRGVLWLSAAKAGDVVSFVYSLTAFRKQIEKGANFSPKSIPRQKISESWIAHSTVLL